MIQDRCVLRGAITNGKWPELNDILKKRMTQPCRVSSNVGWDLKRDGGLYACMHASEIREAERWECGVCLTFAATPRGFEDSATLKTAAL